MIAIVLRDEIPAPALAAYERFAGHRQAAKHNFLAAWTEIDAPVLVIFKEFDRFEARYGHRWPPIW